MIEVQHPSQLARLRRLALAAQGLLQTAPYGRGLPGVRRAIQHLGYVQIDTISVVERAHHHVLRSRVPNFRPPMVSRLLQGGDIFEYWAHAAAFLPCTDFRFSLPYKRAIKSGKTHWFKNPDTKLMAKLLARIRSEGPLRSRDVPSGAKPGGGWWNWKPAKRALEQLYMQGDLMVSERDGFQKTYDLTERVLPAHVDTRMPSMPEFAAHLLEQQLRCHGVVSLKGLTYLRRNAELRNAVKTLVDARLAERSLERLRLPSGEVFLAEPALLERALPRIGDRLMILSPFDNSVIQRERLKVLFEYEYQIECYLPAAKRQFGYFCLPLLYRDAFIGRMDCKAHRASQHLELKSLWLHEHDFDDDSVVSGFSHAIGEFCRFQGCESVSLAKVFPRRLSQPFQRALASRT